MFVANCFNVQLGFGLWIIGVLANSRLTIVNALHEKKSEPFKLSFLLLWYIGISESAYVQ